MVGMSSIVLLSVVLVDFSDQLVPVGAGDEEPETFE